MMVRRLRGFSLIEVIVVIVILGILAGIAIPTYKGVVNKSHDSTTSYTLRSINDAAHSISAARLRQIPLQSEYVTAVSEAPTKVSVGPDVALGALDYNVVGTYSVSTTSALATRSRSGACILLRDVSGVVNVIARYTGTCTAAAAAGPDFGTLPNDVPLSPIQTPAPVTTTPPTTTSPTTTPPTTTPPVTTTPPTTPPTTTGPAPGVVDVAYGDNGGYTFGFAVGNKESSNVRDSRVLASGHTYVLGTQPSPVDFNGTDTIVQRFRPNGQIDTTWGGLGTGITPRLTAGYNEYPISMDIQADGKIVVAGWSDPNGAEPFRRGYVARFNTNGTIDTSFGNSSGYTSFNLNGGSIFVYKVRIQADGKIILSGDDGGTGYVFRLNSNGQGFDTSFAGVGYTSVAGGGGATSYTAMDVQSDGKIVIGGMASSSDSTTRVARLNTNGSIDTTFGTNGYFVRNLFSGGVNGGQDEQIRDLKMQSDGKIVLGIFGGNNPANGVDFSAARLNTNGTLDTTFGSNGTYVLGKTGQDTLNSIYVQDDNKVILLGSTDFKGAAMRLNANGAVDTSFNNGSVYTLNGPTQSAFYAVNAYDGRLIYGGKGVNPATGAFNDTLVARTGK